MQSQASLLASQPQETRDKFLASLTPDELAFLEHDWSFWGRPNQQMPEGDWFVWMVLAGRGFGKTRLAVENIARMVRGPSPLKAPDGAPEIMTIIADSPFDMRQYTIEGPSGFLHVGPYDYRPHHEPSKKTLTWPNGCKALLFSAEDPETLRGASGSFFWWDELAKSRYAQAGWENMLFGMREGNPRGIVTTTPRPTPLLKELIKRKSTHITRGSTWDNKENLSPVFYREVIEPLMGTRLGRQEIEAEILDDAPGALWSRGILETNRLPKWQDEDERQKLMSSMKRIVVAMDPAATSGDTADEMGIVVAGLRQDGHGCVLEDLTERLSPDKAARKAIAAYDRWNGDRIVGEVNNGGEWIGQTIRLTARTMQAESLRSSAEVSYKAVHASRGKQTRAEPIAALDEQFKVHHVGTFPEMEDQLCVSEDALIATEDGLIAANKVVVGRKVWTRKGLRNVDRSWSSGTKPTVRINASSGASLKLTANHPVFVVDKGFVRADNLSVGDIILECRIQSSGNIRNLMGRNTSSKTTAISAQADHAAAASCTVTCGKRSTGLFRKALKFITLMATRPTMSWKTFNSSPGLSTNLPMGAVARGRPRLKNEAKQLAPCGPLASRKSVSARLAEGRSSQPECAPHFAAAVAVERVTVVAIKDASPARVWDLTVSGEHEFFANGILVHNCEWQPLAGEKSPDRLDARVWALTELMLAAKPAAPVFGTYGASR